MFPPSRNLKKKYGDFVLSFRHAEQARRVGRPSGGSFAEEKDAGEQRDRVLHG